MPRESRLYELIQVMRDGRLHTAAELAERLGVSPRTIWRDMATLSDTGLPIEGERGLGYILRTPLVLPPVPLTQDELAALVAGLRGEAASDDGQLSGRGSPWKRGLASGVMTTVGGLGHALPYLIPDFWTATTIAILVVFVELWAIAWIQNRFMQTPFFRAALQVVLGGSLVLAAGVLIGSG